MTPKEKAFELINKFYYSLPNNGYIDSGLLSCNAKWKEAITCALIAVDEIASAHLFDLDEKEYWEEVKIKIKEYEKK